jgi:protein TonB
MVARIPAGLSASAVFHAAVVTLFVLIPVLREAPLPETRLPRTEVWTMPIVPQARPAPAAPARLPVGGRRRASTTAVAMPVAQVVPAVPQADGEPIETASDPTTICLQCVAGGGEPAEGPPGVGLAGPEGTGSEVGTASVRVGSGVEPPRKLVHVPPRYPELARRAGLQGTVELECVIDPSGSVAEIRRADGPSLLRDAAVDAVRQWRYTPTKLHDVPVSVIMTVTVRFSLRRET